MEHFAAVKCLMELNVNGAKHSVIARPADLLLNVLREQLGLTGAKPGCESGVCGACTVLMDEKPVKSCLILAVEAIGHEITTIEGLRNTPIQLAFVEKNALQCGFCTPGIILNCHALLNTHPDADPEMLKEWLQSNFCRCTGYAEMKEAVQAVTTD